MCQASKISNVFWQIITCTRGRGKTAGNCPSSWMPSWTANRAPDHDLQPKLGSIGCFTVADFGPTSTPTYFQKLCPWERRNYEGPQRTKLLHFSNWASELQFHDFNFAKRASTSAIPTSTSPAEFQLVNLASLVFSKFDYKGDVLRTMLLER